MELRNVLWNTFRKSLKRNWIKEGGWSSSDIMEGSGRTTQSFRRGLFRCTAWYWRIDPEECGRDAEVFQKRRSGRQSHFRGPYQTVSMMAKRAGLERWRDAVDMSRQGEIRTMTGCSQEYAVFARVTPKQKQELVRALKRQGHQVAMTGDGVNDLLALREADCSIAVADGSDASRQISQVVLLDSDFTHLPQVVMEGRKVIHNVTRTRGSVLYQDDLLGAGIFLLHFCQRAVPVYPDPDHSDRRLH